MIRRLLAVNLKPLQHPPIRLSGLLRLGQQFLVGRLLGVRLGSGETGEGVLLRLPEGEAGGGRGLDLVRRGELGGEVLGAAAWISAGARACKEKKILGTWTETTGRR